MGYMTYRKYRNVPTEVDGIRFASKREATRYAHLKLLEGLSYQASVAMQKASLYKAQKEEAEVANALLQCQIRAPGVNLGVKAGGVRRFHGWVCQHSGPMLQSRPQPGRFGDRPDRPRPMIRRLVQR